MIVTALTVSTSLCRVLISVSKCLQNQKYISPCDVLLFIPDFSARAYFIFVSVLGHMSV